MPDPMMMGDAPPIPDMNFDLPQDPPSYMP